MIISATVKAAIKAEIMANRAAMGIVSDNDKGGQSQVDKLVDAIVNGIVDVMVPMMQLTLTPGQIQVLPGIATAGGPASQVSVSPGQTSGVTIPGAIK